MTEYVELYKKYRPRNWASVVGQEKAVTMLKNIVINNSVPTGIAFFGNPGCGKTTLAKILTKALNCKNLKPDSEGKICEPCNECSTCISIDKDKAIGFKYISAANCSGVEDMRKLAEQARLSYNLEKAVFIVDEVHNLSKAAFDSLLIPIESEKMNTLFIFCSTERDKIAPAILSRIQSINLPPIHWKKLVAHLVKIAKEEGKFDTIKKEDFIAAAKGANGSARNAIQNLETLILNGVLPTSITDEIITAITKGDIVKILQLSKKAEEDGLLYNKILEGLFNEFTNALQYLAGDKTCETDTAIMIKNLGGSYIMTGISILGESLNSIKNKIIDSKILFEIPIIDLCYRAGKILKEKK